MGDMFTEISYELYSLVIRISFLRIKQNVRFEVANCERINLPFRRPRKTETR